MLSRRAPSSRRETDTVEVRDIPSVSRTLVALRQRSPVPGRRGPGCEPAGGQGRGGGDAGGRERSPGQQAQAGTHVHGGPEEATLA